MMNKVDLKLNAIANCKMHYELLLAPDNGALLDLLDTLMDEADKALNYARVRDELEQLIIWKCTDLLREAA